VCPRGGLLRRQLDGTSEFEVVARLRVREPVSFDRAAVGFAVIDVAFSEPYELGRAEGQYVTV
jgi:hypothetical protein